MPWAPTPFEHYREGWPATPPLALPDLAPTRRFERLWADLDDAALDDRVRDAVAGATVVFVRGYLGNWMPGNLVGPTRGLAGLGIDARLARNRAGATVGDNAAALVRQLRAIEGPVVLCGHSKGGLECLAAADADPALAARIRAVVLSQTPRGPSAVLESVLLGAHDAAIPGLRRRVEEWTQGIGLRLIGAQTGGLQLTREPLSRLLAALDATARPYPVWQTASWSSQPTTWLDSFHGRLGEIRPGCAHDGQFYLEDLLWPGLPHVLLAHVDHAQPVMGGFGFDEVRYWKLVIALCLAGP